MDADERQRRLAQDRNLWLATVRPDGRPHLAPLWFVHAEGALWVCTGATSVKAANLAAEPRVAVSLEDANAPLAAEGLAAPIAPPYPPAVVAAFAAKYGWDIRESPDADLGELVLVRIELRRWLLGGPAT